MKDKPKFYPYVDIVLFVFMFALLAAMLFPSILNLR